VAIGLQVAEATARVRVISRKRHAHASALIAVYLNPTVTLTNYAQLFAIKETALPSWQSTQ
jgi:hypothetical protein